MQENKKIYLKTTFRCEKKTQTKYCRSAKNHTVLDFSEEMKFKMGKNYSANKCLIHLEIKQSRGFLAKSKGFLLSCCDYSIFQTTLLETSLLVQMKKQKIIGLRHSDIHTREFSSGTK